MKPMKDCDDEMIITKNGMKKVKYKEYYGISVECYDISVYTAVEDFGDIKYLGKKQPLKHMDITSLMSKNHTTLNDRYRIPPDLIYSLFLD